MTLSPQIPVGNVAAMWLSLHDSPGSLTSYNLYNIIQSNFSLRQNANLLDFWRKIGKIHILMQKSSGFSLDTLMYALWAWCTLFFCFLFWTFPLSKIANSPILSLYMAVKQIYCIWLLHTAVQYISDTLIHTIWLNKAEVILQLQVRAFNLAV